LAFGRSLRDRAQQSSGPADGDAAEWPPRVARRAALRAIEERISAEPDDIEPRLERAGLLAELGRTAEARDAYLDILRRAPSHRLALNNLGTLLHATGYRTAARTAYTEAAARHPDDPMSRVNLGNVLYESGEYPAALEQYEAALRCAPDHAEAHQGMSYLMAEQGHRERAAWHRRQGFGTRSVLRLPYRGEGPPVSVLLLIGATGGNIPMRHFLDDRVFQTTIIVPEFYDPNQPLPPHQLIFNSIGDADLAGEALVAAQSLLALSGAPVLNSPGAVLATGRADNARRLSRIPGVKAPAMITLSRDVLSSPAAAGALARHGLQFPLLVRTPGFHTGRHFVLVDRPDALPQALAGLPGAELTAIERRRRQGPKVPRHDGRRRALSLASGDLEPLEDPLFHR
jgi:tetratricopeptide (TPR) repeat protein